MVYKWKIDGLYSVPAQEAGQELERIYQTRGKMDPADIVDESRPDDALLHTCFEWRDDVAAERWREQQARGICRCLITKAETVEGKQMEVRAFFSVEKTYHPISVVVKSADKTAELLASAMKELEAFKAKYQDLSQLAQVIEAINALTE